MSHFFPVSAVTKRIKDYLSPAADKEFWVRGELFNVSSRGGHFYASLIETSKSGKMLAKIDIRLWQRVYQQIDAKFRRAGIEMKMENGMQYGFLCRLNFHNIYGIALEVRDADPSFNLGEMERRRLEILSILKKENRFELNKKRILPFLPQKIGLITSGSSAAYSDFMKTLNTSQWGFRVFLADARMQGDATETTVMKALDALKHLDLDIVVITRGGGSRSDLYSLDNLKIARAVSEYHIPVWTGIGHEIDTSVLDMVAHTSFKTPTAVAEDLVSRCDNLQINLDNYADRLIYVWQKSLKEQRDFVAQALEYLKKQPQKLIAQNKLQLKNLAHLVRNHTSRRIHKFRLNLHTTNKILKTYPIKFLQTRRADVQYLMRSFQLFKYIGMISEQKRSLKEYGKIIRAHDPVNNLKRGYSLVYNSEHKIVHSIKELKKDIEFYTRLHDGEIKSKISQIKEDKDGK